MVTPFTDDNRIDYDGVAALIDWYQARGLDGIFAVCQSSEMFYLSLRERVELTRFIVGEARGRLPVIASGHVSESLDDQIEELAAIAAQGPEAVVLVSNRLARADEPDLVWQRNARRLLDALPGVSFGVYECPFPYKRLLSPELLSWCAQTGRFTFLKDTCCNIELIRARVRAVAGTPLKIFNANSATLLESLRAGAAGFSGVMLNFHPELYGQLCRIWRTQPQEAERLQHFATVASLIELQLYPVNAKYHLQLEGVPIGLTTRSKSAAAFDALKRTEVDHLYGMWKSLPMPANSIPHR